MDIGGSQTKLRRAERYPAIIHKHIGGMYFFTVVTHDRQPILNSTDTLAILRRSIEATRSDPPLEIEARGVLPDHLHSI